MAKKIGIIVPEGPVVLSSVIPSFEVFNSVNQYLQSINGEPFFEIELVGIRKKSQKYNGSVTLKPTKHVKDDVNYDLIIVSTIAGDIDESLKQNREFIPWIRKQHELNNTEVASLCVGAFLLAETGLLDGKPASTHWSAAEHFQQKYPQVNLVSEEIITEQNGIYTSGGAFSILNLLLYLVEKYCGKETAIWCSKTFEIDFDRINQNQFVMFNGQKDHNDKTIQKAQLFIENNYGKKIMVDDLARTFATSRRSFIRRFKKATANTPLEYIQRVKIEAAKKSLESDALNINEVMYDVGYTDSKAFRNIFRKYTGLSPLEYKQKYNRISA